MNKLATVTDLSKIPRIISSPGLLAQPIVTGTLLTPLQTASTATIVSAFNYGVLGEYSGYILVYGMQKKDMQLVINSPFCNQSLFKKQSIITIGPFSIFSTTKKITINLVSDEGNSVYIATISNPACTVFFSDGAIHALGSLSVYPSTLTYIGT